MMKQIYLFLFFALTVSAVHAQTTFPVNGVVDEKDKTYAFINATIIVSPDDTINKGTLVISKGKITDTGNNIVTPPDAVVIDAAGKYIYASFIDPDASYGIKKQEQLSPQAQPQMYNARKGPYNWNQAIIPEFNSYEYFQTDTSKNKSFRNAGFGTVLSHHHDGVARGTGALVMLGDEKENDLIIIAKASAHFAFRKGTSTQDYPNSEMGVIALLRQTIYDTEWYVQGGNKEQTNISLQAMYDNKSIPHIIELTDVLQIMRADKICDEFNFQYIIRCGTDIYQKIDAVKKTNAPLIIPLNFPKTPDVEDPFDANLLPLTDLKHWEMAPANAAMLEKAGIQFCFTASGLDNQSDFLKNIRKTIQYGLSEKTALAAITTMPARLLKADSSIGTLEKGKYANFIITSGKLFDEHTIIYQNWVNGKQYIVKEWLEKDMRGAYQLTVDNTVYGLLIRGRIDSFEYAVIKNTDTIRANGKFTNGFLSVSFTDEKINYRLSGWSDGTNFRGRGNKNENWINWKAEYANVYAEKTKEIKKDTITIGKLMYPFVAYGWETKPMQENILFTNVTVWTNEKEGVVNNYDVLIGNGKILSVGKNISAKNARVVDGTGKHLTSGIIDEHSHIAASSGVNEGTQSVSAEVRIGDIINSEDINIYRQLAGGVTTSHILHGSANAIGGQTQLIKLRWGLTPDEMKLEGAAPFIKFALGENVKQANWGQAYTVRFPQTRMGVEQIMDDAFTRAGEYMAAKQDKTALVRTDLELEALAEILMKKRFITCHSYVQSEINMMMHMADKYDFTLNTFTHILEGFKVADKMKEHGAGASSFSDWWGYKFEVYDAIPYNAAILVRMGITTAVNSDDAEMARRLNQEAAKAIKYGGLTEEEAWKLCTLNPAILLHIETRTGSIKEGKDADLVLWNDNPLSIYAKPLQTYVDGICYYDVVTDEQMRHSIAQERARIITKMIAAKKAGESTVPVVIQQQHEYHCEDV
ncbi:MAG: amidohydrolase family protein, partial [Chitinophagales bacterium]|nr:amidohydrolase family protein [Chitinophagales bacterium]